jgi:CheY-like chemotaxis protein
MNILYIEDEPMEARLVSLYMQTTPHRLTVVESVEAARDAILVGPDLIMMDVLIDNTRAGFDLARELRAGGFTQPMMAVTGLSTPQDLEECRDAGFDHVLSKPFTIDELAEAITRFSR